MGNGHSTENIRHMGNLKSRSKRNKQQSSQQQIQPQTPSKQTTTHSTTVSNSNKTVVPSRDDVQVRVDARVNGRARDSSTSSSVHRNSTSTTTTATPVPTSIMMAQQQHHNNSNTNTNSGSPKSISSPRGRSGKKSKKDRYTMPEVELKIPQLQMDPISGEQIIVFNYDYTDIIPLEEELQWVKRENSRRNIRKYFKILNLLGKGVSGKVYEVQALSNGKKYALKEIDKNNKWSSLLFKSESKFLAKLKHPGIIRLVDYYVDANAFYILTEIGNIDLFHRVKNRKKIPEEEAKIAIKRLLTTLAFMHSGNIVHRDLKPENVIFTEKDPKQPKLIDFGDALVVTSGQIYTEFVGTPCYLAPERLRQHRGWELKRSDVWTVGVICFEIVTGKRCFYGKTPNDMFEKIKIGKWRFPQDFKPSPACVDFISYLLNPDSSSRPSAKAALQHAWFKEPVAPEPVSNPLPIPQLASSHQYSSSTMSRPLYSHTHTRTNTKSFTNNTKRSSMSVSVTVSDLYPTSVQSVFNALASNIRSTKLKQILVQYELTHLKEDNLNYLYSAFNALDRNRDGFIDSSDLMETFAQEGVSAQEAAALARTIISELDINGTGRIDIESFAKSHVAHELSTNDQSMRDLFSQMDDLHTGYVSGIDLSHSSLFNGWAQSPKHVMDDLVKESDLDGDGYINFDDFAASMKSTPLIEVPVNMSGLPSPVQAGLTSGHHKQQRSSHQYYHTPIAPQSYTHNQMQVLIESTSNQ